MVSAVKVGGKRLHELARAGVEVEREAPPGDGAPLRRRTRHRRRWCWPSRSSARRAPTSARSPPTSARPSAAAPTSATCAAPPSVRSRLADAHPLDELTDDHVLPPADALRDYPSVEIDAEQLVLVGHGRPVAGICPTAPSACSTPTARLVAVYEDGKPAVVLAPA